MKIYRVLIVDDDQSVARVIASTLQHHGHSISFDCTIVHSIAACLSELNEHPKFDAIILDLNLTNGKGAYTFLKIFSASNKDLGTKDEVRTPIVVVTGGTEVEYSDVIMKGAQDFIPKPIGNGFDFVRRLHMAIIRSTYSLGENTQKEIKEIIKTAQEKLNAPIPQIDPVTCVTLTSPETGEKKDVEHE